MRTLVMSLLVGSSVLAQSVEDMLDQALKATTAQLERHGLLKACMTKADGPEAVARRGLDPGLDSEVVHAVVEVLMNSQKAPDHIQSVAVLLLHDEHRQKVEQRLQRYAEDQAKARGLLGNLADLALGVNAAASSDPDLRVAGVRALSKIPLREAVELIVKAWGRDVDAKVRSECEEALEDVVDQPTPEAAAKYLQDQPGATFYELAMMLSQRRKGIGVEVEEWLRRAMAHATPKEAFDDFTKKGTPLVKEVASGRIKQLAREGKFDGMGEEAFAREAFAAFDRELGLKSPDPKTIANLCDTLALLGGRLLKVVEADALVAAVGRLAASPGDWAAVGHACLRLLKVVGDAGMSTLADFARTFENPAVRREAIRQLGEQPRLDATTKLYVGGLLAQLLESEKSVEVRKQILYTLRNTPVAAAYEPIRRLLDTSYKPPLKKGELTYCLEILRELDVAPALQTLLELAEKHPDPAIRLIAVRNGLLGRKNGTGKIPALLAQLVLSADQPLEVREGVIAALGASGSARAAAVLGELSKADGLEEKLRAATIDARLEVAEAFAGSDPAAALRILREEMPHPRIEAIARAIVQAAGDKPAGTARWLLAQIAAAKKDAKPDDVRKLFQDAAANAAKDKLAPAEETTLLVAYRNRLKETGQEGEELPRARLERALVCSARLAELAGKEAKAGHLLDAADCALQMKDKARAEGFLEQAVESGVLESPLASRYTGIKDKVENLPK